MYITTRSNFVGTGHLTVFAGWSIQARVGDFESLHRLISHNMGLHDFPYVGQSHVAVPDSFGIDHDGGAVFTLVETSGFVGADGVSDTGLGEETLEFALKTPGGSGVATTARVSGGTLVTADEYVFVEFWHVNTWTQEVVFCYTQEKTGRMLRPVGRVIEDYRVDSISKPQASKRGSGIYFEFLFLRAHSRSRVERTY